MCMHFVGLVKHNVLTQAGDIPLNSMCICPETFTIIIVLSIIVCIIMIGNGSNDT